MPLFLKIIHLEIIKLFSWIHSEQNFQHNMYNKNPLFTFTSSSAHFGLPNIRCNTWLVILIPSWLSNPSSYSSTNFRYRGESSAFWSTGGWFGSIQHLQLPEGWEGWPGFPYKLQCIQFIRLCEHRHLVGRWTQDQQRSPPLEWEIDSRSGIRMFTSLSDGGDQNHAAGWPLLLDL